MLKASRIQKIEELLHRNGEVSVQELSEMLGVSSVTVRGYLRILEENGTLTRTRGGGIAAKKEPSSSYKGVLPVQSPDAQRRLQLLAAQVANYVRPNSWIMLSAGKTCIEIAKHLAGIPINVYTSNLEAALILAAGGASNITIPGGCVGYRGEYSYIYGELFDYAMDNISVDQAFVSVAAIDESGLMVANPVEIRSCEQISHIAKEVVVVSDSSKFDQRSFLRISKLNFMHTIVSDRIPEKYQKIFQENGIKMIAPNV